MDHEHLYIRLAAAFTRGSLGELRGSPLVEKGLDELTSDELLRLADMGKRAGLKIHRFKKSIELPRVARTLGILKGLSPSEILDIGTGRGVFLMPLLDLFPALPVTCVDLLPWRAAALDSMRKGGIHNLSSVVGDAVRLPFPDGLARYHYCSGGGSDPGYIPWDDTRCTALIMSGLPGSGKDTWLREHHPELPVVSLDEIRLRTGTSPGDNQGRVVQEAKERAREHLRRGESFAWNATNITLRLREGLVRLFMNYGARVRIVYVETSRGELLRRNAGRERPIPVQTLSDMITMLQVPAVIEAHNVEYYLSS